MMTLRHIIAAEVRHQQKKREGDRVKESLTVNEKEGKKP